MGKWPRVCVPVRGEIVPTRGDGREGERLGDGSPFHRVCVCMCVCVLCLGLGC